MKTSMWSWVDWLWQVTDNCMANPNSAIKALCYFRWTSFTKEQGISFRHQDWPPFGMKHICTHGSSIICSSISQWWVHQELQWVSVTLICSVCTMLLVLSFQVGFLWSTFCFYLSNCHPVRQRYINPTGCWGAEKVKPLEVIDILIHDFTHFEGILNPNQPLSFLLHNQQAKFWQQQYYFHLLKSPIV